MMFVRHGPLWFRIVAILFILWGLAGLFAWEQQMRLGANAMGQASAYDHALHAALPVWYDLVYLVAVGAGMTGAVLLFLRNDVARGFFLASLAAVVVQFGWLFATTDIVAHKGAAVVLPFPLLIVGIAAFAVWLTAHARSKGWVGRGGIG